MRDFHDDDIFCLYCQKQYHHLGTFVRHVTNKHPAVAQNLARVSKEFADKQAEQACENPF